MTTAEHEITGPVDLCLPDGRLNPDAVGWSRRPWQRTNLRGWGRTKRWEYWCVTTPTHLIALTVSDLDLFSLDAVYFLAFDDDAVTYEVERTSILPPRGVRLPDSITGVAGPDGTPGRSLAVGPERPTRGKVRVEIHAEPGGATRLRARCLTPDRRPLEADLVVAAPTGHETMNVVVPWDDRRFQFTSKQTALPASGTVRVGDEVYAFGTDTWATLDHGRGRWPRRITWNWGAASGMCGDHEVGLQFGGKWTAGTGSTENALCVDGRLSKLGGELEWTYDSTDFLKPWTVRTTDSDQVDVTFTPFHNRHAHTDAKLIANRADQCFGRYTGRIRTDDGETVEVDGLLGWAEEVDMRW
ncbi:DUF2804 domain-containing protein [Yinghuangia seranimata]|uniref:DUF2804 domain-containing protein n=1 Tax=Yinghuangia seranimata TaxID=408067 RepID=UPI00248CAD28|nr:DUF2804 domain-containing protein [Yinghuangia seranimata]MDI2129558.1 DUF2804 domain-containing protein [Yinghuangia seranimata]